MQSYLTKHQCTVEAETLLRDTWRSTELARVRRPRPYSVFGLTDALARAVGLSPCVSRAGLALAWIMCPYTVTLLYTLAHAVVPVAEPSTTAADTHSTIIGAN